MDADLSRNAHSVPRGSRSARRGQSWGRPALFAGLAALALATAYSTASLDQFAPTGQAAPPQARFVKLFPPEVGTDGLNWQWMSDAAALEVNARGRFWIGFRASSHRQDRRLQLTGPGAETHHDVQADQPAVYVAGPFATGNASRYQLQVRAVPGARRASRRDVRRLSVFLSTPRVSRSPFAALPGRGFYPSETEVDGSPFNWLRQDGRIDVASASPRSTVAWIRFRARSIDRARQVDVRGAERTWRFTAPPFTRPPREIVVGPIELHGGRASVVLRSTTPPRRYGADTRALSVSVGRLEVLGAPPATRPRSG